MIGMNTNTGMKIYGMEHLKQSIYDIIFTPIGTRVKRRDYGSLVFELIDAPFNVRTKHLIKIAVVDALSKWETRIKINKIDIEAITKEGKLNMSLNIELNNETIQLDINK